jgi:hypothetical protein
VIPPGADISPTSSLFKRVGTDQDGRGKIPGVKGKDGKWHSFDWIKHDADEMDCRRWQMMTASGIGLKMGDGLYLIDVDTMNRFWRTLSSKRSSSVLVYSQRELGTGRKPAT